ncbi:MAG: VanW family protein [Anaerolineae bacterium]
MQATVNYPQTSWRSRIGWFSVGPLAGLIILATILLLTSNSYADQHRNRVYTGVFVGGHDLGEMTQAEATEAIQALSSAVDATITLIDPGTGQEWSWTHSELGLHVDADTTANLAFGVGRSGAETEMLQSRFNAWYYGIDIQPVYELDESILFDQIQAVSHQINQLPKNAGILADQTQPEVINSQLGRLLDGGDAYERIMLSLGSMQSARIELLVHETLPDIIDASQASADLDTILGSPVEFYLQQPVDSEDLVRISLGTEQLRDWMRIQLVPGSNNKAEYDVFIDEVALRGWLLGLAPSIERAPENARFYFDDPTGELVLVEPHTNGRELDIETTISRFNQQIATGNRSVALAVNDLVPTVHSDATATELGITELLGERTTYFYGSTNNRKHNIARAASNFYGLVVAPGEQFSFNKYLGDISIEDGYETGLIILGGQTIEGVGGGVCQVSTTLFQTVFWAGLDIGQRLEHGYQVGYYNDGEGPGMDATVYNGDEVQVDFTFTNNTPHHLLIENYYNQQDESLTFKMYSTDIGRVVEKSEPIFNNQQEPPPDEWIYNEELDEFEIRQVEFAAHGAEVFIERVVYNYEGDVRDKDQLVSNYIPWRNVYEYGYGLDPENLPRNWHDLIVEDE